MRPYGVSKFDMQCCAYGCCGGALRNHHNRGEQDNRHEAKRARHRARQAAKRECQGDT